MYHPDYVKAWDETDREDKREIVEGKREHLDSLRSGYKMALPCYQRLHDEGLIDLESLSEMKKSAKRYN